MGNVDEPGRFLVEIAEQCLLEAIDCCGPERPFNQIGRQIERTASKNGLNVVPAFIGHGIGTYFHGPPEILHFGNYNSYYHKAIKNKLFFNLFRK